MINTIVFHLWRSEIADMEEYIMKLGTLWDSVCDDMRRRRRGSDNWGTVMDCRGTVMESRATLLWHALKF